MLDRAWTFILRELQEIGPPHDMITYPLVLTLVSLQLGRGNVLELWKILDGEAASEPEEYCTALKDRIKEKKFDDDDIKTVEHFGRWFADAVGNYDQLTLSAKNCEQVNLIYLSS